MEQQKQRMDNNVIYVGKKTSKDYVMAAMMQLGSGQNEIHIKARGNSINKCVDVVEILRNRFLPDVKVKNISIGTETMNVEGGKKIGVSTMDIVIAK